MMNEIQEKNVLLTGGTAGIGRAIALKLAHLGYTVTVIGRNSDKFGDLLDDAEAKDLKGTLNAIIMDLTDESTFSRNIAAYLGNCGCPDILINNAGLGYGSVMDPNDFDLAYLLKTNLWSYLELSRIIGSCMIEKKVEGDIINIGSMSANERGKDSSAYVATKSGIQGFTESFRKELNPHNIRVTLIEPGSVGSDMQPTSTEEERNLQNRLEMLNAEDIADTVTFILKQPRRSNIASIQIKPLRQFI